MRRLDIRKSELSAFQYPLFSKIDPTWGWLTGRVIFLWEAMKVTSLRGETVVSFNLDIQEFYLSYFTHHLFETIFLKKCFNQAEAVG